MPELGQLEKRVGLHSGFFRLSHIAGKPLAAVGPANHPAKCESQDNAARIVGRTPRSFAGGSSLIQRVGRPEGQAADQGVRPKK